VLGGCTSDQSEIECYAIAAVSPQITVTDAATDIAICSATVTATCDDGNPTESLTPHTRDGREVDATVPYCEYGVLRCYSATLTIEKPGYGTVIVPGVQTRFSKHCPGPIPDPQIVAVKLQPE
jgi:hypothetical protein